MINTAKVKHKSKRCFQCDKFLMSPDVSGFYTITLSHRWGASSTKPINRNGRRSEVMFCIDCFSNLAGDSFRFEYDEDYNKPPPKWMNDLDPDDIPF